MSEANKEWKDKLEKDKLTSSRVRTGKIFHRRQFVIIRMRPGPGIRRVGRRRKGVVCGRMAVLQYRLCRSVIEILIGKWRGSGAGLTCGSL